MDQPEWSLAETKERVRLSLREAFPLHFGERWEEARDIYLERFRAIHLERLTPLPGARRCCATWRGRGSISGSSATRPATCCGEKSRGSAGRTLFGSVVGAGDAPLDKPACEPVHLALAAERRARRGRGMVCRRYRGRHGMRRQ